MDTTPTTEAAKAVADGLADLDDVPFPSTTPILDQLLTETPADHEARVRFGLGHRDTLPRVEPAPPTSPLRGLQFLQERLRRPKVSGPLPAVPTSRARPVRPEGGPE